MAKNQRTASAQDPATTVGAQAVVAALSADCRQTVKMPDGGRSFAPLVIAREAAVAAESGKSEEQWRTEWTRQLLARAIRSKGDEEAVEAVIAIIDATEGIVCEQKATGIWPWAKPAAVRRAG